MMKDTANCGERGELRNIGIHKAVECVLQPELCSGYVHISLIAPSMKTSNFVKKKVISSVRSVLKTYVTYESLNEIGLHSRN